jgi:hypothetical protein
VAVHRDEFESLKLLTARGALKRLMDTCRANAVGDIDDTGKLFEGFKQSWRDGVICDGEIVRV